MAVKAALLCNVSGRGLGPGTAVIGRLSRCKSMGTKKGAAGPNPPARLVNENLPDISVPRHSHSRVIWASRTSCGHHPAFGGLQRAKVLHASTARFGRPCAELHAQVPKRRFGPNRFAGNVPFWSPALPVPLILHHGGPHLRPHCPRPACVDDNGRCPGFRQLCIRYRWSSVQSVDAHAPPDRAHGSPHSPAQSPLPRPSCAPLPHKTTCWTV
jgi:hypothetical protein